MSAEPVLGMYRASVANNQDPLKEARVTLLIPQVLGSAESAWAAPASPTNTVPPVGQTLWVQFSGGDITKPVYSPLGIKEVQDKVDNPLDVLPPKEPTALGLTTVQYVTNEGTTLARVTVSWTPPTENQDGTALTDLSHYVLQTSYDGTTWSGGFVTTEDLLLLDGLNTGVAFYVRVQAVDNSSNASLWATASITTASASTPPPVPSAPGVTGVLGGLRVTWNGLDYTGTAMPAIFSHVQVQRDTDPAFSNPVVVGTLPGPDFLYDSVQNYASSYNYRLVAYSKVGSASAPSAANSGTAHQAGTADIAANSVTANQMAAGTITASSGIIASIDASKITVGRVTAAQIDATNLQVAAANVTGQMTAGQVAAGAINTEHLTIGSVSGNLITNGGFEDVARPGWALSNSGTGNTSTIEIGSGTFLPRTGQGKLALAATDTGSATATSDAFPVVAAATYMFRYWYFGHGRLHVTFQTSPDKVTWTDALGGANDTTYNVETWIEGTAEVVAPTGALWGRVSFANNTPSAYGLGTAQVTIAVDDVIVMREGYGATDISAGGMRLFGPDGQLATELTSANAHATFAAGRATIDPRGVGSFSSLWTPLRPDAATDDDPTGQLWYQGQELSDLLWSLPFGYQTYERGWTQQGPFSPSTEFGLIELGFTAEEGRMYRIRANSGFFWTGGTSSAGLLRCGIRVSGTYTTVNGCHTIFPTGASPKVTDTLIGRKYNVSINTSGTLFNADVDMIIICSSDGTQYSANTALAPGDHRILWTGFPSVSGSATGWTMANGIPDSSSDFYVEDIGPAAPEGGVYNTGGQVVTPTKTYTKTYNGTWSKRFGNAGSTTGTMYQGYYSSTWGTQKSMVGFGSQPFTDMGSTAKVSKAEIYLYANHWYYNSGGTAHIGVHTQLNAPSSVTWSNNLTVAGWPLPAGQWVTLPSAWNSGWNTGTVWRGITLGADLGSSTDSTYYGIFDGVGDSHPPQLRLTYTK